MAQDEFEQISSSSQSEKLQLRSLSEQGSAQREYENQTIAPGHDLNYSLINQLKIAEPEQGVEEMLGNADDLDEQFRKMM